MKNLLIKALQTRTQEQLATFLGVDRAWIVRGLQGKTTKGIEAFKKLQRITK